MRTHNGVFWRLLVAETEDCIGLGWWENGRPRWMLWKHPLAAEVDEALRLLLDYLPKSELFRAGAEPAGERFDVSNPEHAHCLFAKALPWFTGGAIASEADTSRTTVPTPEEEPGHPVVFSA